MWDLACHPLNVASPTLTDIMVLHISHHSNGITYLKYTYTSNDFGNDLSLYMTPGLVLGLPLRHCEFPSLCTVR